ncbi:MAG TPA: hypothetical protein VK988_07280 [Acidimicrobiales bacterium]|nr:hypothetical protein [Acidimicrobiales bacterium]
MTLQFLPPPAGSPPPPDHAGLTRAADILDALVDRRTCTPESVGPVVPTGIPAFDEPCGGLALGTVTALIGPPGSGSTWLLLRAALHAAAHDRPTLFCALDMTLASFAVGLAHVVTGAATAPDGGNRVGDVALRAAATELAELPLYVEVGKTVATHDIFAVADSELVDFIVVDNVGLLLPSGSATDLKHCATDLNVAALTSITVALTDDDVDVACLGADLLSAADTIASYDPIEQSCRVVVTRAWPSARGEP